MIAPDDDELRPVVARDRFSGEIAASSVRHKTPSRVALDFARLRESLRVDEHQDEPVVVLIRFIVARVLEPRSISHLPALGG